MHLIYLIRLSFTYTLSPKLKGAPATNPLVPLFYEVWDLIKPLLCMKYFQLDSIFQTKNISATVKWTLFTVMFARGGVARGVLGCPRPPPSPFWDNFFLVSIIQVAKRQEFEELTYNKSFPALDSYLLHLQDRTSAVDHIFVPKLKLWRSEQLDIHWFI